jgi:hypothetical protein
LRKTITTWAQRYDQTDKKKRNVAELSERICWSELLDLIGETVALLPLDCSSSTDFLISCYKSCNHFASQFVLKRTKEIDMQISDSDKGLRESSRWKIIDTFFTHYVRKNRMSHADRFHALLSYEILAGAVQRFLNKKRILELDVNTSYQASAHAAFAEEKNKNERLSRVENGDSGSDGTNDEVSIVDDDKVFCFCGFPEDDAEHGLGMMIKCDGCHEWNHPQCMNLERVDGQMAMKREGKVMMCPPCCVLTRNSSGFCKIPETEWTLRPMRTITKKNTGIRTTAKGADLGSSISEGFSSDILDDVLTQGCILLVNQFPVVQMLHVITTEIKEWRSRASTLYQRFESVWLSSCCSRMTSLLDSSTRLHRDDVLDLIAILSRPSDHSNDTVENTGEQTLSNSNGASASISASWLTALARHYFEPRIFRVRSEEGVAIRRAIWHLSTVAALQCLLPTESNASSSTQPTRLELSELQALENAGSALGCVDMPSYKLVKWLLCECRESATAVLAMLSAHCNYDQNEQKMPPMLAEWKHAAIRMDNLKHIGLEVDLEYLYAVAQSIEQALTRRQDSCRMKEGNSVAYIDKSDVDESNIYCWCKDTDDGSPMIACDSCQEWFHCDCVGLYTQKSIKMASSYSCIACTYLDRAADTPHYQYEWTSELSSSKVAEILDAKRPPMTIEE